MKYNTSTDLYFSFLQVPKDNPPKANQLFVVYVDDLNITQYACKPTPGEWNEWSGIECTQQCGEGHCELMRFRECRDSQGEVIPKENATQACKARIYSFCFE